MAIITVEPGTTSSGLAVWHGNWAIVSSGGVALGATVHEGGTLSVEAGGSAWRTMVDGWAASLNVDGGSVQSTTVNGWGASLSIGVGSSAWSTILNGGEERVGGGGTASGTVVNSGGHEFVQGGVAESLTVNNGGTVELFGSGLLAGVAVGSGGRASLDGGEANGIVVSSGGRLDVNGGGADEHYDSSTGTMVPGAIPGVASGTRLLSGATEYVGAGGVASGTVLSGGEESVWNGGVASGTTIFGGTETVWAGGIMSGAAIAGGVLDLGTGGIVAGDVTFVGSGGTLEVTSTDLPDIRISGFAPGDTIRVNGLVATAATLSGTTLTLSGADGLAAQLTLVGRADGSEFTATPDGVGGTKIRERPVPPPTAPRIGGTAEQQTGPSEMASPFATVTITDPLDRIDTATVLFPVPEGALANATGMVNASGFYSVTGTAAQVQAALRGLVFTFESWYYQFGQAVTANLTLMVDNGEQTATDDATNLMAILTRHVDPGFPVAY